MRRPLPALLALLALAACDAPRPAAPAAPDTLAAAPAPPDTVRDTLLLEGHPEPALFLRFDVPGVPFTTYRPADLAPETTASAEGTTVRFRAAFGGTPRDDAYLAFFFPSDASGLGTPGALAAFLEGPDGLFARRGWRAEPSRPGAGTTPCDWAERAWRFESGDAGTPVTGAVCLGVHGGRPFYTAEHVPVTLAEGFDPRAARLLDHLRWRDDGARLGGGAPDSTLLSPTS